MATFEKSLVWFRRDLRVTDHAALYHALKQSRQVYCVFVYDRDILDPLLSAGLHADRRIDFIMAAVDELDSALRDAGGALIVRHASAPQEIAALAATLGVDAVFANHDYEPAALLRDTGVERQLQQDGRSWFSFKDQVIFEKKKC